MSWPLIKQSCYPGYRLLRKFPEIHFSFEHITNQKVRVFTGAFLLRSMRMVKVDFHSYRMSQTFMLCYLFPLVTDNAFHQLRFQRL